MKINVVYTMEIDKVEDEQLTQDDIDQVYDEFRQIIEDAHNSKDLTAFKFVNPDTMFDIEDEVE